MLIICLRRNKSFYSMYSVLCSGMGEISFQWICKSVSEVSFSLKSGLLFTLVLIINCSIVNMHAVCSMAVFHSLYCETGARATNH